MTCKGCKRELLDNETICPSCGRKLKSKAPIIAVIIIALFIFLLAGGFALYKIASLINDSSSAKDSYSSSDIEDIYEEDGITEDSSGTQDSSDMVSNTKDTESSSTEVPLGNYLQYIEGRSQSTFEFGQEIHMENGLLYRLNNVEVTELSNHTLSVEINVDLAADKEDWNLYSDDFLILPTDANGKVLSDACLINHLIDLGGYSVYSPMLLDTENYNNYTLSFSMPAEIEYFTFYATNITQNSFYDSIYAIDLKVSDYESN